MNPQRNNKRRQALRVPGKLYNEAIKELQENNTPWYTVSIEEVVNEVDSVLLIVGIVGEDEFRENRWKLFTLEV